VVDWARSQGLRVTERFPNRLTVGVRGSTPLVERALGVNVNSYQYRGASYYSNDRDPAIPANLASVVHSIAGLNNIQALQSTLGVVKPGSVPTASAASGNSANAIQTSGNASKRPAASTSPRGADRSGSNPEIMSGNVEVSDLWTSQGYSVSALYNEGTSSNPFYSPTTGAPNPPSVAIITACDVDLSNNGDLVTFANQYGLALDTTSIPIDGGASANNNCKNTNGGLNTGLETTLDVEVSNAMANSFGCYCDTAQVFVYVSPSSTPNKGNPTFGFSDNINRWQQAVNHNFPRSADARRG